MSTQFDIAVNIEQYVCGKLCALCDDKSIDIDIEYEQNARLRFGTQAVLLCSRCWSSFVDTCTKCSLPTNVAGCNGITKDLLYKTILVKRSNENPDVCEQCFRLI